MSPVTVLWGGVAVFHAKGWGPKNHSLPRSPGKANSSPGCPRNSCAQWPCGRQFCNLRPPGGLIFGSFCGCDKRQIPTPTETRRLGPLPPSNALRVLQLFHAASPLRLVKTQNPCWNSVFFCPIPSWRSNLPILEAPCLDSSQISSKNCTAPFE